MSFDAIDISIRLIEQLRPVIAKIARHDRCLADQIRRASTGVPLQLAEGAERIGKDRAHLFRVALGSSRETRVALRVAVAAGYVTDAELVEARATLDRQGAVTYRLAR